MLKSLTVGYGEQFAMIRGIQMMQVWHISSLASLELPLLALVQHMVGDRVYKERSHELRRMRELIIPVYIYLGRI